MKTFVNAIIAGIAISIGGVIYLTLENHIAGSFLFSIGLFTIYTFGFNLFTGKVCYIVNEKPSYLLTILIVYLGNFIGTAGSGIVFRHTKLAKLIDHTMELVNTKLADTLFSFYYGSHVRYYDVHRSDWLSNNKRWDWKIFSFSHASHGIYSFRL